MKLAVFSDIHGNLVALEAFLTDLESVGEVDLIWCLGDIAAFGPRPSECVARVRDLRETYGKEKFHVIGGNNDRYLVTGERFKIRPKEDAESLAGFAEELERRDAILNWNVSKLTWEDYEFLNKILGRETAVPVKGYGWVIGYHAIPGDDETLLRPDTPDEQAADALLDREGRLAIGGHIHVQMDRQVENWRIINVGSVGFSFDMPGKAQWGLFTFEDNGEENGNNEINVTVELRAVDYDVEVAIADATTTGHPNPAHLERTLRQQAG